MTDPVDPVFGLGDEGGGPFRFDKNRVTGMSEGEADPGGDNVGY